MPQVSWRQPLGGQIGAGAMWSTALGERPTLLVANGSRIQHKRWDDGLVWQGPLVGVDQILGLADIDLDGEPDMLLASGTAAGAVLVGLSLDGEFRWAPQPGTLGPISGGVRVVDVNGDGLAEVYAASASAGPQGPLVSVYEFPNGPSSGRLLYTIDATHRDYFGSFYDVFGEFDGDPGLELVALGHRRVYIYDAATGALESESEDLGPLPFARARLRAVDVDGDGVSELVAFSNEAWSADNNRRHVSLLSYNPTTSAIEIGWTREVTDTVNDRVSFSDNSATDLDGDGSLEVVVGIYDSVSQAWTTEIRDLATGAPLATIAGQRYVDIARNVPSDDPLIFTHDTGSPLRSHRFSRSSGTTEVHVFGDLALTSCRQPQLSWSERQRFEPCRLPAVGVADSKVIAAEIDARTGRSLAIVGLNLGTTGLGGAARFDGEGAQLSGIVEINSSEPAVVGVARSDGKIIPLDESLNELPPTIEPPFAWGGVRFGTSFSGTDLPRFPTVVSRDGAADQLVALGGGSTAMLLDASREPTLAGGVDDVWRASGADRAVVAGANSPVVVLLDHSDGVRGVSATDGSEQWALPGQFSAREGLILHNDPLLLELPMGRRDLWYHRRDNNAGSYDVTVLDALTGQIRYAQPGLDFNDSGWRRLSSARIDGADTALSGRVTEVWQFSTEGVLEAQYPATAGSMALPVPRAVGNPQLLLLGLGQLSLFDPDTQSVVWAADAANNFGANARLGSLYNVAGRYFYATSLRNSPELRVFDVETGDVARSMWLAGGALFNSAAEISAAVAPALSNVTTIAAIESGGSPALLVGSSDGYLYAIDALSNELLWGLYVDAHVGEVVPADWDGDGTLELTLSATDGTLIGIDSFTGAAPEWVNDTDGRSFEDIDELSTRDTLHATWAAVPDATGYQVAIFTSDGVQVTAGFANVGNTTRATVSSLPLAEGTRYIVSVRALSALGVSSDAVSDGVTVLAAPDAPSSGCCQVSEQSRGGTWLLALLALLPFYRRRSSRSNRAPPSRRYARWRCRGTRAWWRDRRC